VIFKGHLVNFYLLIIVQGVSIEFPNLNDLLFFCQILLKNGVFCLILAKKVDFIRT